MQVLTISPQQCRMARSALKWSIDDLAEAATVGRHTIFRFENDEDVKEATIAKLRAAFEAKRVRFIDTGQFAGGVTYVKAGA
jgi:predicted transcriptional regulator